MSKSVKDVVLCHVSKISGLQSCIYLWSLIPFEGMPTVGPATSSSSPAPREILPLDVLRSTVAPT